jgi:gamma-glutamylcyclotransferase (GGCT)/AIG2-like uncharacterized protein YtfP
MARSVFTYGSLMFERVWRQVVSGRYDRRPAILHGFRRQRVRSAAYPCLRPGEGHSVAGILYLDVTAADLATLDAFEGEDYRRIPVHVTLPALEPADPRPGLLQAADTYLFVAEAKVEPGDWDAERFGRDQLEAFLREHAPGSGQASSPTRSRQRTMSTGSITSKPSRPGRAT